MYSILYHIGSMRPSIAVGTGEEVRQDPLLSDIQRLNTRLRVMDQLGANLQDVRSTLTELLHCVNALYERGGDPAVRESADRIRASLLRCVQGE